MKNNLLIWFLSCAVVTIIMATIYAEVQQNYRQSAYDPQIQMAEDLAATLSQEVWPANALPTGNVNVAKSLATFTVVYDDNGKVIASSGQLNGTAPTPPAGVFDYAKTHDIDRFTWQPQSDVRLATIVAHYSGPHQGFVLVSRSLKEVEKRTISLADTVGLAWLLTILLISLGFLINRDRQALTN